MVTIDVKIGNIEVDRIEITNVEEQLFGMSMYHIYSKRYGSFHVSHNPKAGLNTLIHHVFSHYAMREINSDTPTTGEEW